jgi:hypothetical protein
MKKIKPLFKRFFWSFFNKTFKFIPRTIKCIEALYRGLNFICKLTHLNLAKFIAVLQMENESCRVKIFQAKKSLSLSSIDFKKEYSLIVILNNWELYHIWEFLDVVSRVVCWHLN